MFKFSSLKTLAAMVFTYVVLATPAQAQDKSYSLDGSHTTLAFLVDHVGFAKTLGYFSDVTGTLNFDTDSNRVSNVSINVATKSVQSDNKARDKHLRKKDFLNVGKFPSMTFTAADTQLDANGEGQLQGELTLLGKTRPLTLAVSLNKSARYPFGHKRFTLGVSAKGSLQRSDYGMDYGVANGLVGDKVDLIIEIEAIQDN